jgi:hypothetical protein
MIPREARLDQLAVDSLYLTHSRRLYFLPQSLETARRQMVDKGMLSVQVILVAV